MRCTLTVVSLGVLLVTSTHGENTGKNVFGKKEEYKFNIIQIFSNYTIQ